MAGGRSRGLALWRPASGWHAIAAAAALLAGPAAQAAEVTLVRVEKAARRLTVLDEQGHPLLVLSGIQLGGNPFGPKRFQGDRRTPEGRYVIDRGNAQSAYHLSLHISYPSPADRAFAATVGRTAGGDIFIHGQPNKLQNGRISGDWTNGCVAVSNEEIERLWALVPDGTAIELLP